jgi:hypothetical protein
MTLISSIGSRLCDVRVEAYRAEFGAILADRIIEAEAADFLWESRVAERYLGQHLGSDPCGGEDDRELSRVAILSFLAGVWCAGLCLVDGEGAAVELVWKQAFDDEMAAREAFAAAH